jgi:hypothetical protein
MQGFLPRGAAKHERSISAFANTPAMSNRHHQHCRLARSGGYNPKSMRDDLYRKTGPMIRALDDSLSDFARQLDCIRPRPSRHDAQARIVASEIVASSAGTQASVVLILIALLRVGSFILPAGFSIGGTILTILRQV